MKTLLKITQEDINDGCVPVDSPFAKELGFTSDKFEGYLWKKDNTVFISLITSLCPGKGNVRNLIQKIKDMGYDIECVATGRMVGICEAAGFVESGGIYVYKNVI